MAEAEPRRGELREPSNQEVSPILGNWPRLAVLTLAFGGLILRFRFLADALGEKRIYLFGADPYYHVRRGRLLVERFPDLVYTDPFQNFPHCEPCSSLPAGFDALLALLSLVMPAETVADRVALAGVLTVPLLGMVTLYLVWHLGRRMLTRGALFVALAAAALLPCMVDNSFAGRPDHHVLDPLSALAIIALFAVAARRYAFGLRRWLPPALAAGAVAGLALVSFPSALVTVTIALAAVLLVALWRTLRGQDARQYTLPLAVGGLLAGLGQWAFMALFTPCFGSTTLISNTVLPGLLAMLIGGAAGALVMLHTIVADPGKRTAYTLGLLVLAMGAALAAVLLSAGLRTALSNWLYVMAGNVIPELSPEWRPLWRTPAHWFTGKFTWAFLLIPPGLYLLVRRAFAEDSHPEKLLVAAVGLLLIPLAIVQAKYFVHLYAPIACFAMGAAAAAGATWVWKRIRLPNNIRTAVALVTATSVVGLLAMEPYAHYRAVKLIHWQTIDVLGLLDWVRENTPEADPIEPSYGIMNTWETGFWVAEAANRPVYANNFVAAPPHSVYVQHLESAYRWLLDPNPAALLESMSTLKTPYLLLIPVDGGKLFGYYRLTGQDPGDVLQLDEASGKWNVGPGFLATTFAQLYAHQGSTLPDRPCVSGLQLIRTSEGAMALGGRSLPVAQLYRRVPGALVRGQVAPGETVRIGVILRTTAGTDAPFECRSQAGADGLFEIRFPYASTATEGIQRRSPVLLIVGTPSADNPPAPINIPQDAVENGLIVEMAL
jgi:asparagine N-glycosylation enzyme membrane subunit Stt3